MWQSMPTISTCSSAAGTRVQRRRFGIGDAELVLLEPRGDVRVSARIDVGVHSEADRGPCSHLAGDPIDADELVLGLHVEAQDAGLERDTDLLGDLPTPENTTLAGSPPAASTRASSPPETMSKPLPRRANRSSTARFEFALTA